MLGWIHKVVHCQNSIPEGGEADLEKAEELMKRHVEILKKAEAEYRYEPPEKYFMDGYNLYMRMLGSKEEYLLVLKAHSAYK